MTAAVTCARCGSQCQADVACARGYGPGQCPGCPPDPHPGNPHPAVVHHAWWPDWPEVDSGARQVWTATCGCGWAAAAGDERAAWVAVFDHQDLVAWQSRPIIERPRPDAGPRHPARMRYELEAARLPGVPLRTVMACADSSRDRHPCRGVVPSGAGPPELCACPCHDEPGEPDPCRHCGAPLGHLPRCPTRQGRARASGAPGDGNQLMLFG